MPWPNGQKSTASETGRPTTMARTSLSTLTTAYNPGQMNNQYRGQLAAPWFPLAPLWIIIGLLLRIRIQVPIR